MYVVRIAAARELTEGRAEAVREIQLQGVATRALFDGDAPFRAVRIVAVQARRVLAGDVAGAGEPNTATQTGKPGVVMVCVHVRGAEIVSFMTGDDVDGMGTGDERRRRIECQPIAERPGWRD